MTIFVEISIIIAIAVAVSLVMQLLKQPLVLGHILTGILVGPAVFNILKSKDAIDVFSRLGITALLFIVGLSLSPRVIREVGKVALAAGLGQVVFTTIAGFLIGIAFGYGLLVSLVLAVAFTFSSTIIVSKILSDKHDLNKLYGKISIGILLVQDVLATVVLIIIASAGQGGSISDILTRTLLKGIVIAAALVLASIFLLPSLTSLFAQSQEFLFLFSVGWGIGLASVFYVLGLSIELGALAAGVTLATSPYHYEISAKMKLLRDFFIILFFILLGSQLTASNLTEFVWPIIGYSLFILIGNPIIVMLIMGPMGYSKKTSFLTGLAMAQISEFSLIVLILAIQNGYLPAHYLSLATIIGIVTIAGSSFMMLYGDAFYRFLSPVLGIFERKTPLRDHDENETYNAILFGCHRVGHDFLPSILKLKQPYLVVDFDPNLIATLKEQGIYARYGDAEDNEFLDSVHIDKANIIISTLPDFEANEFLVNKVRKLNRKSVIITIAQHVPDAQKLYKDGANYVVMPHHMGGNYAAMLVSKHGYRPEKYTEEKRKHLRHLAERHVSYIPPQLLRHRDHF